ncbi:unnamed protein product [Diamesa serratosioi]
MVKYEILLVLLALSITSVLCKPSGDLMIAEKPIASAVAESAAPSGAAPDYYYYDYGCADYDYEYVEDMSSEPSKAPLP